MTICHNIQATPDSRRLARPLLRCGVSLAVVGSIAGLGSAGSAQAQIPNSVVSACSGVSLPRSVVTDIMRDPLLGITAPIQGTVNNILGVVGIIPIVGQVFPPLNINVNGLLNTAASGAPISLSVLDNNGTIIGPGQQCNTITDSIQLNTDRGISIGGNRITGLGTSGLDAVAGETGSIAFGNSALNTAGATNAVAIGTNASAAAAGSVAIGAGSVANRAGTVSVGAAGAERQIVNVAAGTAPTDAVNRSQLDAIAASSANAVQYDVDGLGQRQNSVTLVGGAAGPVRVANVAAGTLDATSTEAVNGSQLSATNSQVATNTTNIATNRTNITNLLNGTAGLVQQAGGAPGMGTITVGAATGGTLVDIAGTAGARRLAGVADGAVVAGSTDAVNGGQLAATNSNITNNTTNITNILNGAAGLVQQVGGSPGMGAITVGAATGGNVVNVGGTDGARRITGVADAVDADDAVNLGQLNAVTANAANAVLYDVDGLGARTNRVTLAGGSAGPVAIGNVAAGTLDAASTEAVNGSQLFATNSQVTINTTNIATNTSNITNLLNGTAGLLQQVGGSPGMGTLTVGAATGGTLVDFAGTDGPRRLTGLAAGVNASDAATVGQINQLTANAANAVIYDTDAGGNRINSVTLVGGSAGPVRITNVADGALDAASTDAVNGRQLFATNSQVATNTTNIAANTTVINNILNGAAGLVQQVGGAPGSGAITIGAATGGTVLNLAGTDGARVVSGVAAGVAATDAVNVAQLSSVAAAAANAVQYDVDGSGNRTNSVTPAGGSAGPVTITNVAAGAIAAGSTDAVNGSQLAATNAQVAANTTAIASNSTAITTLAAGIDNGTRGLVQQVGGSPGEGAITVGAGTGGSVVNLAGTSGNRVLTGLAAGVNASDAVTVGQLNQVTANAANAVIYDTDADGNRTNSVTLVGGSAGPVRVRNVADARIAEGSTDAVNGGQLAATNAQLADTRIIVNQNSTSITQILQGQAGAFRSDNTAMLAAPVVSGANATAGGFGAVASGVQTVALGSGAVASGFNSVAIGAGSSDGGEANVVSVGSSDALRRITNVAPGIRGTDAINLSQLNTATQQFQAGLNGLQGQIANLQFDIRDVRRRAFAGSATALAAAGLPQAFTPGKGMIAAAIGQFEGEVAFAFGASKIVGDSTVFRASGTFSTRGPKGFNAGVGYQF